MSPLDLLGPVCTQSFTSYSELIFNLFSYLREANNKFLRVITTLNHCFDLRQQAIGPLEPYVGKGAPYILELPPSPPHILSESVGTYSIRKTSVTDCPTILFDLPTALGQQTNKKPVLICKSKN